MPGRSSWNYRRWPCRASSDWTRTAVHSPRRRGRTETSHGVRKTCGGGIPRTRRDRSLDRGTNGRRTRAEAGGWGSVWSATEGWPRARQASSRTCTRGGASYSPQRAGRPGGRDATRTHSPWNSSRAGCVVRSADAFSASLYLRCSLFCSKGKNRVVPRKTNTRWLSANRQIPADTQPTRTHRYHRAFQKNVVDDGPGRIPQPVLLPTGRKDN